MRENTPPHLVTVGRLTPVKHQAMLLEVLARLPEYVTLTIVGEGPERSRLERMISRLGLSKRVSMPGEVQEIAPYLSGPAVFVLSSSYEGLPVSVLEAMAAGLPVVATAVGGVPEAVLDGRTGYVVPGNDVEGFTARVLRLLEDPSALRRFGDAGRTHYQANFTSGRFLAETSRVYRAMPGMAGDGSISGSPGVDFQGAVSRLKKSTRE
jgi:glycosyltransferase involved in cell wall biosynthesis